VTAVLCVALLSAPEAWAQAVDDATRNAARSMASQARDSFEQRDYERARDLFHRAYSLVPAPTLAVYEARCLANLTRLVEAEEAYMRAARTSLDADSPEQFRQAVREAENELSALRNRIPKVVIALAGAGAGDPALVVTLDGKSMKSALLNVEMPIDPGKHQLTALAPGGPQVELAFSIVERERKSVEVNVPVAAGQPNVAPVPTLATSPTMDVQRPPLSPQKLFGFVAGGIGVAGLATGVVTGVLATAQHSEAESQCPRQVCVEGTDGPQSVSSFRTLRTVSLIGYITGGVGLAAGATLILTAPSARGHASSVSLWVSGNAAGFAGAF
jgi:hypothetical protein